MCSGVCSRLDHQNWSTILLSCTSSPPLLFSFTISSPFKAPWCPKYLLSNLSQVSPRQHFQVGEEGTGLQNLLVFLFIQLRPKKDVVLYGAILDPGLLWDIGYSALGCEGSDHMTVLYLWKCSVEGGGGRSWEEQMECRFLKNVCQADWAIDIYKGACIYCTIQGERFNILCIIWSLLLWTITL